jgi:serine/threonine-protein kinase
MKAMREDPAQRFASARELAAELRELRRRHAPQATEADLGALLARTFEKEKQAEDAALGELSALSREQSTEMLSAPMFLPPTALAFEHRGVSGPSAFSPDGEEPITDPGSPWNPPQQIEIREERLAFQESIDVNADPLFQELEVGTEETSGVYTSPFETGKKRARKAWALGVGVFLGASALGFFTIWLLKH